MTIFIIMETVMGWLKFHWGYVNFLIQLLVYEIILMFPSSVYISPELNQLVLHGNSLKR